MITRCPDCNENPQKVIYYGLPMYLCDCGTLFGFWSSFVLWLPFRGFMAIYEGSYWVAMAAWLRGL
jgi:hypothetical protein